MELELQRMKAELVSGSSSSQQAIEGGTQDSAQQSQQSSPHKFDKQ